MHWPGLPSSRGRCQPTRARVGDAVRMLCAVEGRGRGRGAGAGGLGRCPHLPGSLLCTACNAGEWFLALLTQPEAAEELAAAWQGWQQAQQGDVLAWSGASAASTTSTNLQQGHSQQEQQPPPPGGMPFSPRSSSATALISGAGGGGTPNSKLASSQQLPGSCTIITVADGTAGSGGSEDGVDAGGGGSSHTPGSRDDAWLGSGNATSASREAAGQMTQPVGPPGSPAASTAAAEGGRGARGGWVGRWGCECAGDGGGGDGSGGRATRPSMWTEVWLLSGRGLRWWWRNPSMLMAGAALDAAWVGEAVRCCRCGAGSCTGVAESARTPPFTPAAIALPPPPPCARVPVQRPCSTCLQRCSWPPCTPACPPPHPCLPSATAWLPSSHSSR